ncbi:HP0495 family protein [Desulfotalea psychrophila]|uniref:Uncharacterized protein n=1 Tax=Desulfotalea psychrophila (strain LSv54 / DSM 12343) TaxID=177439 RepID=Q6AJ67_DESPS|nr:DUF493 domain-containing protein [Desulfotalea psychrophila]CAG37613.1 hypothetical protein DP2884 [Desulfotalea psychrophila LSv54]
MLIQNTDELKKKHPEIEYPCRWQYKVIGEDATLVKDAIVSICTDTSLEVTYSHTSSGGKYHSFNASIKVESEAMRLSTFESLKAHPSLKMVL